MTQDNKSEKQKIQQALNKKDLTHNEFYKDCMSNLDLAKDFFSEYLPINVKSLVDFTSLEVEKDSFITANMSERYCDILFKANIADQPGYLYLLCEHQSGNDPLMALRLMEYTVCIIQNHLKKYKNTKKLPLVLPLVYYTGSKKYTALRSFWDLFIDPALMQSWHSCYPLVALNSISDEELAHQTSQTLSAMNLAMKHVRDYDIIKLLQAIGLDKMPKLIQKDNWLTTSILLYYKVHKSPPELKEKLRQTIKTLPTNLQEDIMKTWGEEIIQEGIYIGEQRGIPIGIQIGKQEGIQEEKQQIAKMMLRAKEPIDKIMLFTKLSEQEIAEIKNNLN